MKIKNLFLTLILGLFIVINTVHAVEFKTTVVKPVDNVGNEYFSNEIAGFTKYNPSDKVTGKIGTYSKIFKEGSFNISASNLIVKDVLQDKEKDTIRYKLIGLKGTEKAEKLTQTCNFEPCNFDALKILSNDKNTKLDYTYSRQYRLKVESSSSATKELPKVLVTHNNIKNNFVHSSKDSFRVSFKFKNNEFKNNEFFFNIASFNEDYKQHLLLHTFIDRQKSYLKLIGFSDKGEQEIATWSLSSTQIDKFKDDKWHELVLDLEKKALFLDAIVISSNNISFERIATEVKGEVLVQKIPSDIRKKIFPANMQDFSGKMKEFSIFGLQLKAKSVYPIVVAKENLNISFDIEARTWKKNDQFFKISKEGESPDNSLRLYLYATNYLQLDKGEYAGNIQNIQINNGQHHIELRTKRTTKQQSYSVIDRRDKYAVDARYWSKNWRYRNSKKNTMNSCMSGYGEFGYSTYSTGRSGGFLRSNTKKYWVRFYPYSSMSERNHNRYQTCIYRTSWDNRYSSYPSVYKYITKSRTVFADNGYERSAEIRIDRGSWKELKKETDLKKFLKGGSVIRGNLELPSQEYVSNFKINGKAYDNERQVLYRKEEPTLLSGAKEFWINEGDGVELLSAVKGAEGLTVQSSSFTEPNGSPRTNTLETTTLDGEEYYVRLHTEAMRPSDAGTVHWQYGAKIYEFNATIGMPFSLDQATIYDGKKGSDYRLKTREQVDKSFLEALSKMEPTSVIPIGDTVPVATAVTNSYIYSPLNPAIEDDPFIRDFYKGQLYFTRPGRYKLSWTLDGKKFPIDITGIQQLVVEVNVNWPKKIDYHQVAETNAVPLDFNKNDNIFFKELRLSEKYKFENNNYIPIRTEVSNIKIDENQSFSFDTWTESDKNMLYRSVLYFTQAEGNKSIATGDLNTEKVVIKVVESRHWSNKKGTYPLLERNTTIGEEIKDANHTVAAHTGCILKSKALKNARYNLSTYNANTLDGAIFAVNQEPQSKTSAIDGKDDLVVAWYKSDVFMHLAWPNKAVRYSPQWPDANVSKRIVVASRLGSDGLEKANGKRQFQFDSSKYTNFKLYNQPDQNKTGYNPNEEHALLAPSFYHSTKTPKPQAVFALRNDLNRADNSDANYTSKPYVLVQYQENNSSNFKMAIYYVVMSDSNTTDRHKSYKFDTNADGKKDSNDRNDSFTYVFKYPIYVGDKVVAPYPLNMVIGANTIKEISGSNDNSNVKPYWKDKDANSWVVTQGTFSNRFWYPMLDSFWHPIAKTGKIIPWSYESNGFVSDGKNYYDFKKVINTQYESFWKIGIPELRLGETLTFAGGEEKKDNPKAKGLPSAVAWASAEVISDSRNAEQNAKKWQSDYSVKIRPVVRKVTIELANKDFPKTLEPATKLTTNKGGKWFFEELHAGLKQRVYYDQSSGKIVLRGILNERFAGDKLLTKSPGGYNYILQPNILTIDDLLTLRGLTKANDDKLKKAFTELYALSLDPTLSKEALTKVHFDSNKNIVFVKKQPLDEVKHITLEEKEKLFKTNIYAYDSDTSWKEDKNKAEGFMRNDMKDIVLENVESDMKTFFQVIKSTSLKDFLTLSKTTLRLKAKITTKQYRTNDTDKRFKTKVTATYLSEKEKEDILSNSENIPELLYLYALIVHPGFSDFDNLSLKEDTTILQVAQQLPSLTKTAEDREVEYVVGLTRFLRDKNNRYLVSNDLNGSSIKLSLDNGQFPSALKADDLELVEIAKLPYGVTISELNTTIELTKGGKLVRIKEGHGYIPSSSLGVGLGLITNANLAKPKSNFKSSHIVIAENNNPAIKGSPIQLHIFKVNNRPYRGQIKTVLSDNAFDEKITLRHTGDFGGNVKDLIFEWYYRETDNVETPPYFYADPSCSEKVMPTGAVGKDWKPFVDDRKRSIGQVEGQGRYELVFGKTAGKDVLVDNSFYVRYKHKESNDSMWSGWAGSGGNNPCNKPAPVFKSQLVKGWVKRVTDKINVYDARISNFSGDAPATYVSMVEQVGMPYVGDVALNDAKDVVENVGLAALYQTVLNRAQTLSINAAPPASTDGVVQALQNAASRISKFYTLLGNEAYSDALDPTIGYSTNERTYGELAPTIFAFQNQLASLNEEELVLLRGKAGSQEGDTGGAPVHNRLLWNFTNNDGEAAYALSYNIKDKNKDGFINEKDAKIMYPQGHGDAWGHYLTSLRGYYNLLQHPQFNWVSRAEKYEIDGITLNVDYLDERTFIQAAAYKSKVGSEVLDLTYKDLYEENPDGQWQGYKDTKAYRAWGVDGWVKRTHIGAYCDWVVGNAILPSEDTNHTGIQKIDRKTVGELQDISVNGNAILTKLGEIDSGLNPLGLLPDVVPFDIEPGSEKSHFEQVYERAEEALKGAKNVFDYANSLKQRIRQVANSQEKFKEQVDDQDREYRNRLVELFGTPYEGVVGAGKAYPEGYNGPDVNFYQYIDVADLSEKNLPKQNTKLTVYLKTLKSKSFKKNGNQTQELFHKYFSGDFPEGFTGDLGVPGTDNLTYPLTKGRYAFNAPKYWGQRKYPGALQSALMDIVKADVDLHLANKAYTGLIDDLKRIERDIRSRVDLKKSNIRINNRNANNVLATSLITGALEATISVGEAVQNTTTEIADAMSEAMPKAVGFSNDVTSAFRGTLKGAATVINRGIDIGIIAANAGIKAEETRKELVDLSTEVIGINAEAKYDIKQHMSELDGLFDSEPELRLATFKARELVRSATNKYRTVLGKSLRLLEERIAFNKKTASKTQGKRYQDMAFRLNRNAAAQKYKASFNMAAKYAYLAAKAYDYETNLSPKAAASAQHILKDIIQASTLGSFKEGATIGQGGLADILARLKANFAVLKTQMGFNNPQTELAPFSLRQELFRIKADSHLSWEKRLAKAYVKDIWKIPEFRTHMRPFAAESRGTQPGLVIPFSTTIESGKNFFGHKLSSGDHAYDASQFSTRIKSVGIWLDGYKNLGLAQTSRAYLVPVGQDIMYVPDSNDLDTREWNVKDQKIPAPLPFGKSDMEKKSWSPIESLDGAEGQVRRHSRLRVYNDSGEVDQSKMQSDSRLFGRSVWNSRWLLVIPGESLLNPSEEGIQRFIHGKKVPGTSNNRDGHGVSDIKLIFSTYSYSGN